MCVFVFRGGFSPSLCVSVCVCESKREIVSVCLSFVRVPPEIEIPKKGKGGEINTHCNVYNVNCNEETSDVSSAGFYFYYKTLQ